MDISNNEAADISLITENPSKERSGIFASVINLANSIVGSGILGLPFAFAAAGWSLGYIFLVIAAIFTIFSLHILSLCCKKLPAPVSFYSVANASIPKFTFLIDFSVASMCFGVALSYLIVVGGLLPEAMDTFGARPSIANRHLWIVIALCFAGPLSCFKNIDALKFTSTIAIGLVIFLALLFLVYAVDPSLDRCDDDTNDCTGNKIVAKMDISTMKSLGVFVFAYSCQMVS